jgi:hypothetical protein
LPKHLLMTKTLSFILFCCISFASLSQNQTYTGLKSKGLIPEDFTTLTLRKIKEAQDADQNESKSKFYELSNFGVDKLLQSGRVCFNDTISNYTTKVLNEIRKTNKSVPENLRVYTVKSPIVNAFTTDQGIIFINTGLLAQLVNEAQLAFILCHEIVHYTENHVMEGFLNQTDIEKIKDDYKRTTQIDKELATTRFSRELEKEADQKGLEMFLNTGYAPSEVDGVFDVLLYSHLPFDEIPFDSTFLEVGSYKIPSNYFLIEYSQIEVDENEDDTTHTHPNIGTRRQNAQTIINKKTKTGQNFLVSEEEFLSVRKAARIEVLRLQIISSNYPEALYSAYILSQDYPHDPLPQIAIGEILYGAASFDLSDYMSDHSGNYKNHQGFVQSTYYLLNRLNSENTNLLALRYNLFLHQKYPEHQTIENRVITLCENLKLFHDIDYTDLNFNDSILKTGTPSLIEELTLKKTYLLEEDDEEEDKEYDNEKEEQEDLENKAHQALNKSKWARNIFFQSGDSIEIKSYFEKGEILADQKLYAFAKTDDPKRNKKSVKQSAKHEKTNKKKGRSLGIEKIVLVDPYYTIYDFTDKEVNKQIESENEEIETLARFENTAEQVGLEMDILTPYRFDSNDVQKYNDFSLLNEWVNERFEMGGRSNYPSSTEEVKSLIDRYDTPYFAWSGLINTSLPREKKILVAALSLYMIPALPYGIYYLLSDNKTTHIYFAVFNIETGQLAMYINRPIDMKDNNGLLNSQYYDIFNQIRN